MSFSTDGGRGQEENSYPENYSAAAAGAVAAGENVELVNLEDTDAEILFGSTPNLGDYPAASATASGGDQQGGLNSMPALMMGPGRGIPGGGRGGSGGPTAARAPQQGHTGGGNVNSGYGSKKGKGGGLTKISPIIAPPLAASESGPLNGGKGRGKGGEGLSLSDGGGGSNSGKGPKGQGEGGHKGSRISIPPPAANSALGEGGEWPSLSGGGINSGKGQKGKGGGGPKSSPSPSPSSISGLSHAGKGRGQGGKWRVLSVGRDGIGPDLQVDAVLERVCRESIARSEAVSIPSLLREASRVIGRTLEPVSLQRSSKFFNDLSKLTGDIIIFVQAFVVNRSISTLYDLERAICDEYNTFSFDELGLGPLLAQKIVQDIFLPSAGLSVVPNITALHAAKFLKEYMHKRPYGTRVDASDFISALAQSFKIGSPHDLCIRTSKYSFPGALLKMFGVVNKKEKKFREDIENEIMREVREDVELWVADSSEDDKIATQDVVDYFIKYGSKAKFRSYADMIAFQSKGSSKMSLKAIRQLVQCATAVLYIPKGKLRELLDNLVTTSSSVSHAEVFVSLSEIILRQLNGEYQSGGDGSVQRLEVLLFFASCEELLSLSFGGVKVSDLGHGSFLKLLCEADPSLVEHVFSKFGVEQSSTSDDTGHDGDEVLESLALSTVKTIPSAVLESAVADALARAAKTFGSSSVDVLQRFLSAEAEVSRLFGMVSFHHLDSGGTPSIFEFVCSKYKAGTKLASSVDLCAMTSDNRIDLDDIFSFLDVLLLGERDLSAETLDLFGKAVCDFFSIDIVSRLGYGDLSDILAQKQLWIAPKSMIISMQAMVSSQVLGENNNHQGLANDYRDFRDALCCLEAVPYLVDCEAWLQWSSRFEKHHGNFREFAQRAVALGDTSFAFVEDGPSYNGKLFKYDSTGSVEKLKEATKSAESSTIALQLVSLFAQRKGDWKEEIDFINTMAIIPCMGRIYAKVSEMEMPLHEVCNFAFSTLRLVPAPLQLSLTVALIDPLFEISSEISAAEAQQAFLDVCRDASDRSLLHSIGLSGRCTKNGANLSVFSRDFEACLRSGAPTFKQKWFHRYSEPAAGRGVAQEKDVLVEQTVESSPSAEEADSSMAQEAKENSDVTLFGDVGKCRSVIHDIRTVTFGVGPDGLRSGNEGMAGMLDRSLERISADLYSDDTHFVLELIQNADDNSYSSNVIPRLSFQLSRDSIIVLNNETGFTEANVRALCNVGNSTKGAGGMGYIGQKGIGFKSVFSVSDQPSVFSNGFHFSLDVRHKVIPKQIDVVPKNVREKLSQTVIVLPLNEKSSHRATYLSSKFEDITPLLLLFLNKLRRLTVIDSYTDQERDMRRDDLPNGVVELKTNGEVERFMVTKRAIQVPREVARHENAHRTEIAIAIALSDGTSKLYSPDSCPVFSYLPTQPYGLRFILQGDFILTSGREAIRADSPWNQFLRSELPALFLQVLENAKADGSPLDIQLILDCIPLETEVYAFFKPSAKEIVRRLKGWDALPTEDGGWATPSSIVLGASALVRESISAEVLDKYLSKKYLRPDVALRPELSRTLGVEFLSSEDLLVLLEGVCGDEAASLQNEGFGIDFIARWMFLFYQSSTKEIMARAAMANQGDKQHEKQSLQLPANMLKRLRRLPMLPLKGGLLTSFDKGIVFFPEKFSGIISSGIGREAQVALDAFQDEIRILDVALSAACDSMPQMKASVHRMLSLLGVQSLTERVIIDNHIIPQLQSSEIAAVVYDADAPRGDAEARVCAYVRFVKCVCFQSKSAKPKAHAKELLANLRAKGGLPLPVCIVTRQRGNMPVLEKNKQWRYGGNFEFCGQDFLLKPNEESPLFLTPQFSVHKKQLEILFRTVPMIFLKQTWRFVDMAQLLGAENSKSMGSDEAESWKCFLESLGVVDFARVRKYIVQKEEISQDSHWFAEWGKTPDWEQLTSGISQIHDWVSVELQELLSGIFRAQNSKWVGPEAVGNAMLACACMLADIWEDTYARASIGGDRLRMVPSQILSVKLQSTSLTTTCSSLVLMLKSLPWLPSLPMSFDSSSRRWMIEVEDATKKRSLRLPTEVFFPEPDTYPFFREHVAYLDLDLAFRRQSGLWPAIGVQCLDERGYPSAVSILNQLRRWAGEKSFKTCVAHMEILYQHIAGEARRSTPLADEIRRSFLVDSLVWMPNRRVDMELSSNKGHVSGKDVIVEGTFYSLKDLSWNEPSFVVDALAVSAELEAEGAARLPRVLAAHYKSFSVFFSRTLCERCRFGDQTSKYGNRGKSSCTECIDQGVSKNEERAAVCAIPTFDSYVRALVYVSSKKTVDEGFDQAMAVISMWGASILDQQQENSSVRVSWVFSSESDFWPHLIGPRRLFPTVRGEWKGLKDGIVLNNHSEYCALFQGEPSLWLLKLSTEFSKELSQRAFYEFLGVPCLSGLVEESVIVTGTFYYGGSTAKQILRFCIPIMQRWLKSKLPILYQELCDSKIDRVLKDLKILPCSSLDVLYLLHPPSGALDSLEEGDVAAHTISRQVSCECYLKDVCTLYIRRDSDEGRGVKHEAFIKEILRLLMKVAQTAEIIDTRELKDVLYIVGIRKDAGGSDEEIEQLLCRREIHPLSDGDDEVWPVPDYVPENLAVKEDWASADGDSSSNSLSYARTMESLKQTNPLAKRSQAPDHPHTAWPLPAASPNDPSMQLSISAKGSSENVLEAPSSWPPAAPFRDELLFASSPLYIASAVTDITLGGQSADDIAQESPPPHATEASEVSKSAEEIDHFFSHRSTRWTARPLSTIAEFVANLEHSSALQRNASNDGGGNAGSAGSGSWLSGSAGEEQASLAVSADHVAALAQECLVAEQTLRAEDSSFADLEIAIMSEERVKAANLEVGRPGSRAASVMGEAVVFHAMRAGALVVHGSSDWKIEWANADGESFLPYDIRLSRDPCEVVLVEVKTTTQSDKQLFEVSTAELECAKQHGSNYMIARVFLAAEGHRVVVIKSPFELIQQKVLDLLIRF